MWGLESLQFLDVFPNFPSFFGGFVCDYRGVLLVKIVCNFGRAGNLLIVERNGLIFRCFCVSIKIFDDFEQFS